MDSTTKVRNDATIDSQLDTLIDIFGGYVHKLRVIDHLFGNVITVFQGVDEGLGQLSLQIPL